MSNSAKRSELAEQIELARQSIERWPEWLKDAAGVENTDANPKSSTSQGPSSDESQTPVSDGQE